MGQFDVQGSPISGSVNLRVLCLPAHAQSESAESSLRQLRTAFPQSVDDFRPEKSAKLKAAADRFYESAAALSFNRNRTSARQWLSVTRGLLKSKALVDASLASTLELRGELLSVSDQDATGR